MASWALKGILITGSGGQVGGELVRAFSSLPQFESVYAPSRVDLDLSDPGSIRRVVREFKPRWILNPAAYTAVDRAESEPEAAYAINAEAVGILGEEARSLGAAVLHFSTDYVFDGNSSRPYTEADISNPQSVYGASKLAGEQALAASGAAYLIFRTSWVYGATGKNFLRTILRAARERRELRIVDDQHGAPTWSRELARMTTDVVRQCEQTSKHGVFPEAVGAVQGVYHATCAGETTWFGFAKHAIELAQEADPEEQFAALLPISTEEYPTPAARPSNSRLDSNKLARAFGIHLVDWRSALADVMGELNRSNPTMSSV